MKIYKIMQIVEKNLFSIESKLDEINTTNEHYAEKIIELIVPPFISTIITIATEDRVIKSVSICSLIVRIVLLVILFFASSIIAFFVIKAIVLLRKKVDNKKNDEKRNKLASVFYLQILPELYYGASLFEKAYESEMTNMNCSNRITNIDAEKILLSPIIPGNSIGEKTYLYYYEALYHFKLVDYAIRTNRIIEYKDSDREELLEFYKFVSKGALLKALSFCIHCVDEISKRVEEDVSELRNHFEDYIDNLS